MIFYFVEPYGIAKRLYPIEENINEKVCKDFWESQQCVDESIEIHNVIQIVSPRKCVKNVEGGGLKNSLGLICERCTVGRGHFLTVRRLQGSDKLKWNPEVNCTDVFEKMKMVNHVKF